MSQKTLIAFSDPFCRIPLPRINNTCNSTSHSVGCKVQGRSASFPYLNFLFSIYPLHRGLWSIPQRPSGVMSNQGRIDKLRMFSYICLLSCFSNMRNIGEIMRSIPSKQLSCFRTSEQIERKSVHIVSAL